MDDILQKIRDERARQDAKWGEQNHSDVWWHVILSEEFGEVPRAIFEGDEAGLDAELIQVAAVAVAWLESRRRRK